MQVPEPRGIFLVTPIGGGVEWEVAISSLPAFAWENGLCALSHPSSERIGCERRTSNILGPFNSLFKDLTLKPNGYCR